MPHRYIRLGPFGFGFDIWGPEWWMPSWIDVERTADEVILTLKIPRDIKKEDVKVEYREGWIRVRFPWKRGGAWETIPIE
jgi:HSP20 family molecular chaperone IbpA